MNTSRDRAFLPKFLFGPAYKVWRHLLFGFVIAIITFNQVFVVYQDSQDRLGNRIYLICFSQCILYLSAMYFNYRYLAPEFLLKERYRRYWISLFILVLLLPTLTVIGEFGIRNALNLPHRISSYTNPLILVDNLANSTLTAICFCGVSLIMLFRKWKEENERVSGLEAAHLKAEQNKLKSQLIAPAFLSKVLRNASDSVTVNQNRTTDLLMKLGYLLRYQLYDCNRDKVLLQTELRYLEEFLKLEQLNGLDLHYNIHVRGDLSRKFVSPQLFITLVQCLLEEPISLNIFFHLESGILTFVCASANQEKFGVKALSTLKNRLALRGNEKHSLELRADRVTLKIRISE